MCKTKKVFFIDSNNRNASSASGTDFTIDLDHPLTLPDGCGVAIDSLSLPDTSNITPIVAGVNDKLYFSLDDGKLQHIASLHFLRRIIPMKQWTY